MNILGELADVVVLRTTRLLPPGEKGDCVWKFFTKKRDPAIGFRPGAAAFIKRFARTVERSRDDLVSDIQTWSFVSFCLGEIAAVKTTQRGGYRIYVVSVN